MARERYNWLDIMKLIAIWLMYTTHYDGMGRFGILGLYSVLGILFFSSGFTAFTRKDSPLLQFIKGKFISMPSVFSRWPSAPSCWRCPWAR